MLNWFREKFFSVKIAQPSPSEILVQSLQSEIIFLREQVKFLQEKSVPQVVPPRVVVPSRPMKFDSAVNKYVPKTDQEIEMDRQGLRELGVL